MLRKINVHAGPQVNIAMAQDVQFIMLALPSRLCQYLKANVEAIVVYIRSEQRIYLSLETMSLIRRKIRISAKQVAEILGCAENTVHNRGAGTHTLTRIRDGRRQIRFLLEEVTALAEMQENNSTTTGPTKKQEENGHQRSLTL
jgi:DNA-binding Xre family transcriptional regulator